MANTDSPQAPGPKRLRSFLSFFRGYMGLWSVLTAALPIPVTYAGAIPVYTAQKAFLSTYTSLFCFLVLGFVFYSRHVLARHMLPEFFLETSPQAAKLPAPFLGQFRVKWNRLVAVMPLLLILGCAYAVYGYHQLLVTGLPMTSPEPPELVLKHTYLTHIPSGSWLMLHYLLIFLTAECAFILMALKEYLQDLLGLTDLDIIRGPSTVPTGPAP